ncbi:uncharacterized protein LOC104891641 [Beta vulgaris subsp. vulgaris]|uniref:uncharacterized protein LOC104891641 n=1 Tax=Beta vulgaris subsp. vulgaris TaxID=3555 RepID=UPI002036BAEE|nr:uncharacterized protein LOC104891641 [Beta vulgaris subsp. vulgaris]
MAVLPEDETLIEKREAEMVSPSGGKSTYRIAHFLNPSFSPSKKTQTLLNPPPKISQSSKPIFSILKSLSSKVLFHGWKNPLKNWNFWVKKLSPSCKSIWKQSCIYEAIMGSTHEIPKCRASMFALAEKWCPESNTFVLPWGEVTITLEDVMVLGGFSVTGESVLSEISSKNLLEIEEKLLMGRSEMMRTKSKKASQQQWLENWMGKEGTFEHEAFLCLWLSRYVLPADDRSTMNKSVFQIAVLLARGTKIALAPAVLACIYRDLRLLKEKIVSLRDLGDQDDTNVTKVVLWAPLQLLQVWIWERFPTLSPKSNPIMSTDMPRLMRWNKVRTNLRADDLGLDVDSAGDDFRWRPYSMSLNNWSFEFDLQSYGRCIRVSQLVGLDCIEPYFPHRVAMQFGLDQDIPVAFPRLSDTAKETAWRNYNRPIEDIKLYMPQKLFESDVTMRYLEWWKKSTVMNGKAKCVGEKGHAELSPLPCQATSKMSEKGVAEPTTQPCLGSSKISMTAAERVRIKMEKNEAEVPPGFSPKGKRVLTDDSSDQYKSSSKKSRLSPSHPVIDIESSESNASRGSSFQTKGVKPDDNFDDHQTLTELFGLKGVVNENRSRTLSMSHRESPSSSAGDNAFMQATGFGTNYGVRSFSNEECTRKEVDVEDGTESKAGSPISIDKDRVQTSFDGASESPDIDLLGRIARLQRIVDMVIAAKISKA